jgi:hypothetical protein
MINTIRIFLLCVVVLSLPAHCAVGAETEQGDVSLHPADSDAGESIARWVLSPGGTAATSVDFSLLGTIGQAAIGLGSSTEHILNSGFWPGMAINVGACCIGRVGDANMEGDYPDEVTLGDIMLLVDVKFVSGDCSKLPCIAEADVNQDGGTDPTCEDHVTLGDIMTLVDFLFITGPENATLPDCL